MILPLLFVKLRDLNYLQFIPGELSSYLEKIYLLNHERNKNLILEIKEISKVFNEKNIKYVFLKGAAMIINKSYSDNGERMIGDIDILIHKRDIQKSLDTLENIGYKELKEKFFNTRHFPRRVKKDKLFGIEPHHDLLKKRRNLLNLNEFIYNNKCTSGISIPTPKNMLLHNIYGFQINDNGSINLNYSYRNLYDSFVLSNGSNIKLEKHLENIEVRNYSNVISILKIKNLFNKKIKISKYNSLRIFMKINYRFYRKFENSFLKIYIYLGDNAKDFPKKINMYFFNKNYRNYIKKKLQKLYRFNIFPVYFFISCTQIDKFKIICP